MKKNKLDAFTSYIADHLKFEIVETYISNESTMFGEQMYLQLPVSELKFIKCGNQLFPEFIENLNKKKIEAIVFLIKTFKKYRENFGVFVYFSEIRLKEILNGYYNVVANDGNYMLHKEIGISYKQLDDNPWDYV